MDYSSVTTQHSIPAD